ncbi:MAG: hypothetical protein ACYS8X_12355 [Planctomycetota bacterium]|jgi:hypothetical protein
MSDPAASDHPTCSPEHGDRTRRASVGGLLAMSYDDVVGCYDAIGLRAWARTILLRLSESTDTLGALSEDDRAHLAADLAPGESKAGGRRDE